VDKLEPMTKVLRIFAAGLLLLVAQRVSAQAAFTFSEEAQRPERYETGGATPLPAGCQAKLDKNADMIGLGLNTDWIGGAQISVPKYVDAVDCLVTAVREERVPGCVLFVNRIWGDVFPLPIGNLMTDPTRVRVVYSTAYETGELTGALTAVPLTLRAIERGDLRLDQTLGELLPEVAGGGKEGITIEELLRGTAGLPCHVVPPYRLKSREAAMRFLNELPRVSQSSDANVPVSRYSHLLLGLILENIYATTFQELAEQEIFGPFGMVNTTFRPPVHWRQTTAPGPYLRWLGRMAWAEPTDELTMALGRSAASGGLITTADDLGLFARSIFPGMSLDGAYLTTQTLELVMTPAKENKDCGVGYRLNGFGPGSIGFDAREGCSLWIQPSTFTYLVFLSNRNHPIERADAVADVRNEVFPMILGALEPLPAGVGLTPGTGSGVEYEPPPAPP
jgi:CubicO group peptidase (beta-lactamase class C family)